MGQEVVEEVEQEAEVAEEVEQEAEVVEEVVQEAEVDQEEVGLGLAVDQEPEVHLEVPPHGPL